MPTTTIPLVVQFTTRTTDAWSSLTKDQRFINCIFTESDNPPVGSKAVFVEKRPGWETNSTPAAGSAGNAVLQTVFDLNRSIVSVFGTSTLTVYLDTTACGVLDSTNPEVFITQVLISSLKYVIISSDTAIFYLAESSFDAGLTFTADRTAASVTLANVSSFSGLIVGQAISGTGIATGARIASLNPGGSSLDMTLAATSGAGTSTTVTREYIAKIMDSDLPSTVVGPVVTMDGYLFTGDYAISIRNSAINSVTSWESSANIPASFANSSQSIVQPFGVWKSRNNIIGVGYTGIEWFRNLGNAFGSPLQRVIGSEISIGANSTRSVTQLLDDVYFVSSEISGSNGIYVIKNTEISKVSDQTLDNILSSVTSTNAARLNSAIFNGIPMLFLTITQSSEYSTFVIYPTKGMWGEWTGSIPWVVTSSNTSFHNFTDSSLGHVTFFAVSNLLTAGKVYKMVMQSPVYQDDGSAYTMTIQTQPYYLNDGEPFWIDEVNLIADTQSSGSTTLATSADDYATFGTVGSFDLTQQQKNLPCGGYYDSSVAFKLTDSGNNAWRGQALKIKWRPAHT